VINIENQLISQSPQDAVNRIGALIVGAKFRPFEMDHVAYPLAEFGDACYIVDRKNNIYQSIVTDVNFQFFGYTTLKCTAESPLRNSSKYSSNATNAIVKARQETKQQISTYDLAVQQLTNLITQSFGVYKSEEVLEDGSVIYYMHNKPTLAESKTIWKMTADAFAVSTDGGQTWNAGLDADGNAVVNVLSAIGINAEWIQAKDLQAIGATIGGWKISSGQIYKSIDLYPNMTASGLANVGADDPVQRWVWMRSPKDVNTPVFYIGYMKKSDYLGGKDLVYPIFSAKADGTVIANTFSSTNANITGGSISIKSKTQEFQPIILSGDDGQVLKMGPYSLWIENGKNFVHILNGYIGVGMVNGSTYSDKCSLSSNGMITSQYTYDSTTAYAANVYISNNGMFQRSASSSKRYKTDITDNIPDILNPRNLYDVPVKSFRYKDGYLHDGDPREKKATIGLIVEDLEKSYPDAVQYDGEGRPEMWNSNILIPAMLKLIQEQNKRLEKLEQIIEKGGG